MQSISDKDLRHARWIAVVQKCVAIRCMARRFLMQRINLLAALGLRNSLHSLHSLHVVQIRCTCPVCAMQCNETHRRSKAEGQACAWPCPAPYRPATLTGLVEILSFRIFSKTTS